MNLLSAPAYFETLPLHPQPAPLESLTSYLARLAEANDLSALHQLHNLFFPDHGSSIIQEMADYPWTSYGRLPTVAACSETNIQATTFYHLLNKFQRSTLPQAAGQFLAKNLVRQIRYCPQCLQDDQPYYPLTWRFGSLSGCPKHGCCLEDGCGHCGCSIPLLAAPFRLGYCPTCQQGLHTVQPKRLSETQWQTTREHAFDLAFLLQPQAWEQEAEPRQVGPRLRYFREQKGISMSQIVDHLGSGRQLVQAIEGPHLRPRAHFGHYLAYSQYVGVSMVALFNMTLPPSAQTALKNVTPAERRQQQEAALLQSIDETVSQLIQEGKPITQEVVAKRMGRSVSGLKHYPEVNAHLQQMAQKYGRFGQKPKQVLQAKVAQIVQQLQSQNISVTQDVVAAQVGLSTGRLRLYPEIRQLIAQAKAQQTQQRQQQLQQQVQQVIEQCKVEGKRVTELGIARSLGISAGQLRYYPAIRELIRQARKTSPHIDQPLAPPTLAPLEKEVKQAIATLQAQDCPVTDIAICTLLGRSKGSLHYYPQLAWVSEVCRQDQVERKRRYEQALLVQVEQAIETLQTRGIPLTQKAIAELTGLSLCIFRDYPRLKELAKQFGAQRQQTRIRQAQQRDLALLTTLEAAITALKADGVVLTQRAVAQRMGVSLATLVAYPKTHARLKRMAHEQRLEIQNQAGDREAILVDQVQTAIAQLRQTNRPVTQKAIAHLLGRSQAYLRQQPRVRQIFNQIAVERQALR